MQHLIEYYLEQLREELESTPESVKICKAWESGLLVYDEAIKALQEAAKRNKFDYIIQYQKDNGGKYRTLSDILYTYREAAEEVLRLQEVAPAFKWRYKAIKKTA